MNPFTLKSTSSAIALEKVSDAVVAELDLFSPNDEMQDVMTRTSEVYSHAKQDFSSTADYCRLSPARYEKLNSDANFMMCGGVVITCLSIFSICEVLYLGATADLCFGISALGVGLFFIKYAQDKQISLSKCIKDEDDSIV